MKIIAKDGLLWCDENVIPLPRADELARAVGYQYAEDFVKALPLPNGQYYSLQSDGRIMLCNANGTRSIFDDIDE